MTLQASGAIKLSEIADEFSAPFKVPLTEMVRGGEYVPDCGTGFPNENIATSGAVSMTSFYEGDQFPNPVQLVTLGLDGGLGEHRGVGTKDTGLIVSAFDGLTVPADPLSKFCVDIKFRLGPDDDRAQAGQIVTPDYTYNTTEQNSDFQIGLCQVNPATSSYNTVRSNLVGPRIRHYFSYNGAIWDTGPAQVSSDGFTIEGYMTEPSGYLANLPGGTVYTHVRVIRGHSTPLYNGYYTHLWKVQQYNNNFLTEWDFVESVDAAGPIANAGGYLTVLVNPPFNNSHVDMDIAYIRGYVGSDIPQW